MTGRLPPDLKYIVSALAYGVSGFGNRELAACGRLPLVAGENPVMVLRLQLGSSRRPCMPNLKVERIGALVPLDRRNR